MGGAGGINVNIAAKKFYWIRSPSAWERTVAWREKQQEARANYEAGNAGVIEAFASASTNLVAGMGDITSRVAVKRIQAERAAKALDTRA